MMKKTKVYDWNGVLITVDGFKDWLRETDPELFNDYFVKGEENKELKRKVRPQLLALYEDATNQGLYPVDLLPNVNERLEQDEREGYVRTIFTSSPRKIINFKLQDLSLTGKVDEVIVLDDIITEFGLQGAMKEDPVIFKSLIDFILKHNIGQPATYTEDSQKRLESALEANRILSWEGRKGFERIYLFDPKAEQAVTAGKGYTKVNDLLLVS
ncbi:MAG: hypothetical protein KAT77_03295 [Nanoarchaeota archaeon]|nr:hypothetical protein [Nanoarchaeota archaeon]